MFNERDTAVAEELLTHCGESVTYARPGGASATVTAVIGRTEFWGGDAGETHDRFEQRDFLILASDLATFTEPADGDTITDAAGEWVLDSPGGRPRPYDWADAARTVYRLHAWQGRGA